MSMNSGVTGQSIADVAYTKYRLMPYDLVLGLISGALWGCPAGRVVDFYDEHVSGNHLDVGVGTGYFLDHCRFPVARPRLVLMDSNLDPLEHASKRLARYEPTKLQANVLRPVSYDGERFDSVGINHVVHCLPGTMHEKGRAFGHLRALMKDGAILFGATVLGRGVKHNELGALWLRRFNAKGVLDNARDDREGLEAALREHFSSASVRVVGRTALFHARA
ncbi:class I SAM-dependent methyltransferase [Polyangium aurulentum]|uniref:class I SAM-dependent methyltransferase n=1 Tax=Polyangium aurulentum TaxID=2567896 RepID=UPI0010AEABD4|nr:class I SAM-dependent methyltransferase [Polyangium aurulentum]UQA57006.1 class I SAM-dependent methyltransferase [Polyangium aurulentum]